MVVQFQKRVSTYTIHTTVSFPAQINDLEASCEISGEALCDHFGARSMRGTDLVAAFEANRKAIESVASNWLPVRFPAGRCLLVTADF